MYFLLKLKFNIFYLNFNFNLKLVCKDLGVDSQVLEVISFSSRPITFLCAPQLFQDLNPIKRKLLIFYLISKLQKNFNYLWTCFCAIENCVTAKYGKIVAKIF